MKTVVMEMEASVAIACAYIGTGLSDSETLVRKSTALAQLIKAEVMAGRELARDGGSQERASSPEST